MNHRFFHLALILQLAAATGCKDAGPTPPLLTVPAGAFVYSALDASGSPLVRGWFTLVLTDTAHVTGEWHCTSLTNRTDIGPQTGDGVLAGSVVDTTLSLNLNPGWVDNNVLLSGKLTADAYRGRWAWVTFAGVSSEGAFEAVRN